VGIALGSASQIALFVAPVLLLLSYVIGPAPMDLHFWPGAVVMMFIATMTASLITNGGQSAWFVGVLVLTVYLIFAMTPYLLPPRLQSDGTKPRNTTEHVTHREYHMSRNRVFDPAAPEIKRSEHKAEARLA
jgi:Ca2+:H+ antiporter